MILILIPNAVRPNRVVAEVLRQARDAGEEVALANIQGISLLYHNEGQVHVRCLDGHIVHPDIIFHWLSGGRALNMLDVLDQAGYRLVNSVVSWRAGRDKAMQLSAFERHGIPHPWSVFTHAGWPAMKREASWDGHEYVLKPQAGGRGHDIQKASDPEKAGRLLANTDRYREGVLLQEYLDHHPKPRHHYRINVIAGEAIVGGRLFAGDNWVTNQARGGRWEEAQKVTDLPKRVIELAIEAVEAIGADYSGVDIIEGQDGSFYVLETNEHPGLGLETAVELGKYVVEQAREERARRGGDAPDPAGGGSEEA